MGLSQQDKHNLDLPSLLKRYFLEKISQGLGNPFLQIFRDPQHIYPFPYTRRRSKYYTFQGHNATLDPFFILFSFFFGILSYKVVSLFCLQGRISLTAEMFLKYFGEGHLNHQIKNAPPKIFLYFKQKTQIEKGEMERSNFAPPNVSSPIGFQGRSRYHILFEFPLIFVVLHISFMFVYVCVFV